MTRARRAQYKTVYIKQAIKKTKKQQGDDQDETGRCIKTLKVLRDRCPKDSINTRVLVLEYKYYYKFY